MTLAIQTATQTSRVFNIGHLFQRYCCIMRRRGRPMKNQPSRFAALYAPRSLAGNVRWLLANQGQPRIGRAISTKDEQK
jgi:hypothetical protein